MSPDPKVRCAAVRGRRIREKNMCNTHWQKQSGMIRVACVAVAFVLSAIQIRAMAQPATAPAAPVERAREASGAKVDESAYRLMLYVDPSGDDARDGQSARTALKTVAAAVEKARAAMNDGQGVRILLGPGVYREGYLLLNGNEMTDAGRSALFILEGAAKGKVAISGAVAAGWEPSTWTQQNSPEAGTFTYRHAWPFEFAVAVEEPQDVLISFREMVIFNGQMLKQEASAEKLAPGRFFIDRQDKAIYVTMDRQMLGGDVIEIPDKEILLTIRNKSNFVLRNIDFVHSNAHIQLGNRGCVENEWGRAVEICNHGAPQGARNMNILIEDCAFDMHNAVGIGLLTVGDVTLRRCTANTNGWKGMGVTRARNVLIEDCETSYNAWRQLWSTSRFHDSGGIKIIPQCDTVTLRRHKAFDNTVTHGIWTDSGITNIVLDECRVEGHTSPPPIYFEMGRGPHLVRNCFIKNRGGIILRGSSNFIFEGNHIEAERGNLITLMIDRRNQQRGRPDVEGCVLRNNRFVMGRGGLFNTIESWKRFYDRLSAQSNTYTFGRPGRDGLGFYNAEAQSVSFEDWQRLGFDTESECTVGSDAPGESPEPQ
jgi:hypothetical protein